MTEVTLACACPTKKHPEGRTGTPAGYAAHRANDEAACGPCVTAWSAKSVKYIRSMSPEALEVRAQSRNDARRRSRAALAEKRLACAVVTQEHPDGSKGTAVGYKAHIMAGQRPCPECRRAEVVFGGACMRPTLRNPDGTTGSHTGYQAHRSADEEACEPCLSAHSSDSLARRHGLSEDERARFRTENAAASKKWREANPDEARQAKHRVIGRNRAAVREAKNRPCTDCGIQYPYYVMEFDHLDADTKEFHVSAGVTRASHERLLAEIAKCEVVCANCHAERTHQQRQSRKEADARPLHT